MSYAIANIILGTHLPWDKALAQQVLVAHVEADPNAYLDEGETREDVIEAAKRGDFEFGDVFDGGEPWHKEYHGAADSVVAWVGVQLGAFDETDHLAFESLTNITDPTDEQFRLAVAAYESLPETVRKLVPPFGLYIVWSTS